MTACLEETRSAVCLQKSDWWIVNRSRHTIASSRNDTSLNVWSHRKDYYRIHELCEEIWWPFVSGMRNDWHATFKNNIIVISCKSAQEAKPMKLQNTKGIISANHSDRFFELYCSMLLNSSPASSLRGSEVLRKSEFSSTWRTPTLHECTEFASLHFECHFPAKWTTCSSEARCLDLGAGVRKQCSQAYSIASWYAYTVTKS